MGDSTPMTRPTASLTQSMSITEQEIGHKISHIDLVQKISQIQLRQNVEEGLHVDTQCNKCIKVGIKEFTSLLANDDHTQNLRCDDCLRGELDQFFIQWT